MENEKFAMEIIKELKANSKRWFVISVIMFVAFVGSNLAWLYHDSQYETISTDESIEQEQTDTQNSSMSGVIN